MYKSIEDLDLDQVTEGKVILKARVNHYNNTRRNTVRAYRIFTVNNTDYTAKGYWKSEGKLYKDRIKFQYTSSYNTAKKAANKILENTKEICVAIESILTNKLYIIYKNKTEILKIKYSHKTSDKRKALQYIESLTDRNGGATVEVKGGHYIVTSYK